MHELAHWRARSRRPTGRRRSDTRHGPLPVHAVGAEERGVEVAADPVEQRVVARRVGHPSQYSRSVSRDARHVRHVRVVRGRHEAVECRHAGGRHPVAEAERECVGQSVAVAARPLRHPFVQVALHRGIRLRERAHVAVALVRFPRDDEPERVPGRSGAAAVGGLERRLPDVAVVLVRRGEQRYLAVRGLVVEHVLEELPVQTFGIEEGGRRASGELRVAGPRVLLIYGRVGDHALQVALDGPRGVAMDAVERGVRRNEGRGRGHR